MAAPVESTRERVKMCVIACVVCVSGLIIGVQQVLSADIGGQCHALYRQGTEAYLDERWQDCVDNFEEALTKYQELRQRTVNCRLKCRAEAHASPPTGPQNTEDLQFYERLLWRTLCLLKCNERNPQSGQTAIPKTTEQDFEELKPYEYLQLCYYQKHMFQKAASAVFTFLVAHPDNQMMLDNLKFYSTLPEVNMNDVVNFEARDYISLYVYGVDAYHKNDYKAVISFIEESLEDYLRGEEECRAYCEGPFDQGWFPDFISSIANHFTYCLKCKQRCPDKLNSLNGEEHKDLLPSHYHFLQFAYYKVGDLKKACGAVASYLLFLPGDETMLNNKEFYSKLPKVESSYFTPREEAVLYVQRREYEIRLLKFIETDFVFHDQTENEVNMNKSESIQSDASGMDSINSTAIKIPELFPPPIVKFEWPKHETTFKPDMGSKKRKYKEEIFKATFRQSSVHKKQSPPTGEELRRRRMKRAVEQVQRAAARNIRIVMGEKELKGKHRFVADGVANKSECRILMELAQVAAVQGDGYRGNKSPHTDYEKFEGVTLGRAALLVYFGLLEVDILDMYLKLSELGRDYLERYFNLKTELYFSFTHLVCRTALPGMPSNRSDMSHPVHADNCNLQVSGECTRKPPAYTWRDYSAIIYLNDNFEGGEFIFATDIRAKNIQSLVKPQCGRMVGFSAGSENLHGVQGVRRGKRCAVGLWFTLNPLYEEVEHILAKQVVHQVQQGGSVADQLVRELRKHVSFQEPSPPTPTKSQEKQKIKMVTNTSNKEQLTSQNTHINWASSPTEYVEVFIHKDTKEKSQRKT